MIQVSWWLTHPTVYRLLWDGSSNFSRIFDAVLNGPLFKYPNPKRHTIFRRILDEECVSPACAALRAVTFYRYELKRSPGHVARQVHRSIGWMEIRRLHERIDVRHLKHFRALFRGDMVTLFGTVPLYSAIIWFSFRWPEPKIPATGEEGCMPPSYASLTAIARFFFVVARPIRPPEKLEFRNDFARTQKHLETHKRAARSFANPGR